MNVKRIEGIKKEEDEKTMLKTKEIKKDMIVWKEKSLGQSHCIFIAHDIP